jgi:F-type H+-transporting ATPase subunit a
MVFLFVAVLVTSVFWIVASRRAAAVVADPNAKPADYVPTGIANVGEALVDFVRNSICVDVIGPEGSKYFPLVGTIFFGVLFSNLLGLIPGLKAGTGTMGTTVAWALIVFVVFTWLGFAKKGFIGFWKSFIPSGVPIAMAPFMFILELISYLIRPVTLSVRLFANLFAGHVVLGVFALFTALALEPLWEGHIQAASSIAILTLAMNIIMYAFEVFVAFIQAYVFSILTAVYISQAIHAEH